MSSQVFRRALRCPLTRPGSAMEALATGEFGPPFPSGFKPPPLPRHPPGGGGSPACIHERGGSDRRLAGPRPPESCSPPQATHRSLPLWTRSLPPSSRWVPEPTSALPPSPVFLSSLFPSPHYPTTLLCVSDSGAGPVTSNPVWRRRDWPARAIKRATSSFPITHCQSGNRGGPAGNYKLNTPYRLAPLPGASSFRPPTLLCQP